VNSVLGVRSYGNAVLLSAPNSCTTVLRYFNSKSDKKNNNKDSDGDNKMPLSYYLIKHFFYIPPVLIIGSTLVARLEQSPP
jgi:hypothetical protein